MPRPHRSHSVQIVGPALDLRNLEKDVWQASYAAPWPAVKQGFAIPKHSSASDLGRSPASSVPRIFEKVTDCFCEILDIPLWLLYQKLPQSRSHFFRPKRKDRAPCRQARSDAQADLVEQAQYDLQAFRQHHETDRQTHRAWSKRSDPHQLVRLRSQSCVSFRQPRCEPRTHRQSARHAPDEALLLVRRCQRL